MIEEYNCLVTGRTYIANHLYLNFKPKRNVSDRYRLTIRGTDILIAREENDGPLGKRVLLSVDLHNPRSLKTIRDWLETL